MKVKDKRFLITQPMMHSFCGSTVVTIELADYLKSEGAEVEIYSYTRAPEIADVCRERKIKLITPGETTRFRLLDYDYVWIHSQVFPEDLVGELPELKTSKNCPYFIFLHMSPHDYAPDEFPWIYQFEEKLADKVLFVSQEIMDIYRGSFTDNLSTGLFQNPAPLTFMAEPHELTELKKVLLVSNHVPAELAEAAELLRHKGIMVEHLGMGGDTAGLISADILTQYDLVVTIGKTVQYCLLANKPVYIYDSFGGPGYLTNQNFREAEQYNFSGRGFDHKTANEIVDEIILQYPKQCDYGSFSNCNLDKFKLDQALRDILDNLMKRTKGEFAAVQIDSIRHAQRLAQYRFEDFYRDQLNRDRIAQLERETKSIQQKLGRLETSLIQREQELHKITSAKSYKLLTKIFKPINKLRGK